MSLNNKIALVIGAGEITGSTIAIELARSGAKVIVEGSAGVQEKVLRTVETFGGNALPIRGDMSIETDVRHVLDNIEAILGHVDIVVNVYPAKNVDKLIEDTSYDEWDKTSGEKIRAAFLCCKEFIPNMKRRGCGQIIFIGSSQSAAESPGQTAISAAEYGIIGLHKALEIELSGTGIQTLYISPEDYTGSTSFEKSIVSVLEQNPDV